MSPTHAEFALEGVRFVASIVYLLAGFIVTRREVDARDRPALMAFGLWWIGLGIVGFYSIPFGLGVNVAEQGMFAYRFVIYTLFPLIYVALAGLMFYLVYLYTGSRRVLPSVLAFYAGLTLVTVFLVEGFGPSIGTDPETGETAVVFAREHAGWLTFLFGLAIIVPPLAGAVAYFLLFFRVHERAARYRIALVSSGIVVWFSYSLFNAVLNFMTDGGPQSVLGQAIGQGLGLLSSLLVLIAFAPPRRVRTWLESASAPPEGVAD